MSTPARRSNLAKNRRPAQVRVPAQPQAPEENLPFRTPHQPAWVVRVAEE